MTPMADLTLSHPKFKLKIKVNKSSIDSKSITLCKLMHTRKMEISIAQHN